MSKPTILKLNIFGNIHTIQCQSSFNIQVLNQFCTLDHVRICDDCILANVTSIEKPYSQMLKKINGVMVK